MHDITVDLGIETPPFNEGHQQLAQRGWIVSCWSRARSLLEFAQKLGDPVPSRSKNGFVDLLRPLDHKSARPNSLSAAYGVGPLPLHTDSANFRIPPRFVVLRIAPGCSSDRPTLVADGDGLLSAEEEISDLRNDVWLVNGGRGRFYTSIVNDTLVPGFRIVRYDEGCMRPIEGAQQRANLVRTRVRELAVWKMHWREDFVLVLDNWRVLHGRGAAELEISGTRGLERILVRGYIQ
jgi:hypothetical protein